MEASKKAVVYIMPQKIQKQRYKDMMKAALKHKFIMAELFKWVYLCGIRSLDRQLYNPTAR